MLVPSRARELIEAGAKQALSDVKAVHPYDPGKPCEVKVEYKRTTAARQMRFQHGVEFLDDRTIVSRADDWWTAWKQFFFVDR
jgi:D-amino peptidase